MRSERPFKRGTVSMFHHSGVGKQLHKFNIDLGDSEARTERRRRWVNRKGLKPRGSLLGVTPPKEPGELK